MFWAKFPSYGIINGAAIRSVKADLTGWFSAPSLQQSSPLSEQLESQNYNRGYGQPRVMLPTNIQ